MFSSPVMTFKRNVESFISVSFSSWQIATRLSFWSWVNTRHKLRCNPMHVQLFCKNSLTRSITNSNLCTNIMCGTTTIVVDSRPYVSHFWGGCCRAWPSWSIIIISRSSTILETSKPFKSSAMAHARITKSLFQHYKCFTSRFTQSHTELDAHSLFVNFHHTDIRKSQMADAIHT